MIMLKNINKLINIEVSKKNLSKNINLDIDDSNNNIKLIDINYINNRIDLEICDNTINKLKDTSLINEYKGCKSVQNEMKKLELILEKYNIETYKKELILNDYILDLIPAGTKGVIRGNKFNSIVKDTINNLVETANSLQKFVSEYESNKERLNRNFGTYQIKIVDEQINDEGIPLKRRYGIALDSNGVLVVQSTPTFASLDEIIINEVKVLLVSNGFVKSQFSSLGAEDIETMNESLNYVGDIDINIDDLGLSSLNSGLDDPDNEDPDQGLGLNAFVNNLPGGKALRRRMRKQMIKNNEQFIKDLKKTDPNGKYSNSIIKEKQVENNKLKVEELETEKKKLIAAIAVSLNPIITAASLKKIKEIDDQIKKLKNG